MNLHASSPALTHINKRIKSRIHLKFIKEILLILFLAGPVVVLAQPAVSKFHYQAVLRDAAGPILEKDVLIRLSVLSGSPEGKVVYTEYQDVFTGPLGIISLEVGTGTSSDNLADIDWSVGRWFLKVEADVYKTTEFIYFGTSEILAVPYALYSGKSSGSNGTFIIRGNESIASDSALFEVKDKNGNTVFAVYEEGVRVWFNESAKGGRGGFAVGGRNPGKAGADSIIDYLAVTTDSVRVYFNEGINGKGGRGGFAVGSRSASKGITQDYLSVNEGKTSVYSTDTLGGFGVTGTAGAFMRVTPKNYFIGQNTGDLNTTGKYNSFMGYKSGMKNTTGNNNLFLGYFAGWANTTASFNSFVGNESGRTNTIGGYNSFFGYQSGYSNVDGFNNLFMGHQAGFSNINGNDNIFLGYNSGYNNTSGSKNLFVGYKSGFLNQTGSYNSFMGFDAGYSNTSGSSNTFLGSFAGLSNLDGSQNTFVGSGAGQSNTGGDNNIFIGSSAGLNNNMGDRNIFIGPLAGLNNADGSNNIFVGNYSGYANTTGYYNLFIGFSAGSGNTEGARNIFLGDQSGYQTSSGSQNTFMGYQSGYSNTTGTGNVFIGHQAGYNETASNRLYIANTSTSSPLIGGDFLNGRVGINRIPTGNATLEVGGTIWANGTVITAGLSTWSDARFKTAIRELKDPLSAIMQLRGVQYEWNREAFPDRNFPSGTQTGLIAQEVEKILPDAVSTMGDGYKSVSYEEIIPLLVEGMKSQQGMIDQLKRQNEELQKRIEFLEK
ncbi:MAG: tail fiber domain-containing protein [Bacteroidales bacterium]